MAPLTEKGPARGAPGRADLLQRRARRLVVHGGIRELEGVVGAHGADTGSRRRGHRRRERLREGRARDLAPDQGPEMRVPRVLPGQKVHDDKAEASGGPGAVRDRARPHAYRDAAPGGAVARALPRLVRLLGRLPRGHHARRREAGLHPREAQEGKEVAVLAGLGGDALHLPRPRAHDVMRRAFSFENGAFRFLLACARELRQALQAPTHAYYPFGPLIRACPCSDRPYAGSFVLPTLRSRACDA